MLNSRRDYLKKRMDIVRLLSLPAAQTAIVKRLGKKRERRKRRLWIWPGHTIACGGMVLLVKLFFQKSGAKISG